jgi:hypothetical protein
MNSIELKGLIVDLEEELKPLLEKKSDLTRRLKRAESVEFIQINKITRDNVQRCDDDGIPWLGDVFRFGEWCKTNSSKPWCCWNGTLYLTSEIQNGRMALDAVGRYEDLTS